MHRVIDFNSLCSTLRSIQENRAEHKDWTCFDSPSEWDGGFTFSQSVDCVEYGWTDAPLVRNVCIPALESLRTDLDYSYEVSGEILDVATYLSGEPECWLQSHEIPMQAGKIIRLAIEIGGRAYVGAGEMANRGQAIIALVNSLEMVGYSIELTIVRAFHTKSGAPYKFLFPIKYAGEPLNMQRVQFLIGHPSFYRKCLFGFAEHAMNKSMGNNTTYTEEYAPDGYTHISHLAGLCSTLDESLQWAQQFAHTLTAEQSAVSL